MTMSGRPPMSLLFDSGVFPLLSAVESAYATIRREMEAIPPEDYIVWPDTGAYTGDWRLVIFEYDYPIDLGVDFAANQARCPETVAFVRSQPAIFAAGYSRLEPGAHIFPHVDEKPDTHVRGHMGLDVGGSSRFRVGEELHGWRDGEALVFDGLIDHEVVNFGSEPRTLFIFDFTLSREELAYSRDFMRRVPPHLRRAGGGAGSVTL